jgi:TPR repeat protein
MKMGMALTLMLKKHVTYYKEGCEKGDGSGCGSLGLFYENGIGVEQNLTTALAYYQHACESGDVRELC